MHGREFCWRRDRKEYGLRVVILWLSPERLIRFQEGVQRFLSPIFPLTLERRAVVRNGVPVRRVRRQEQQRSPRTGDESLSKGAFVEGGVIHHDDMIAVQLRTQFLGEPRVEERGRAAALKQARSLHGWPHLGGNQGRAGRRWPDSNP